MKKEIEGIAKDQRQEFKSRFADDDTKVSFKGDNATLNYSQPYIITDEELTKMSRVKKDWQRKINEFRMYQFNS